MWFLYALHLEYCLNAAWAVFIQFSADHDLELPMFYLELFFWGGGLFEGFISLHLG